MKRNLSKVEKVAIEWAQQRVRYMKAEHLGKAKSRTALYEKAEMLQAVALDLMDAHANGKKGK